MRFLGGGGQAFGRITGGGNANVNYGSTDSAAGTITVNAAVTNLQAAGADAITVTATTPTGPTATGNAGSGTPLSVVPPFIALNFIIRYL